MSSLKIRLSKRRTLMFISWPSSLAHKLVMLCLCLCLCLRGKWGSSLRSTNIEEVTVELKQQQWLDWLVFFLRFVVCDLAPYLVQVLDMQWSWLRACFSGRRPFLERLRAQEEKDEVMQALEEYRKPRDALLILVSDFIRICAPRLEELEEASLPPRYTVPELLDHISVNVRVVISFLKKTYIKDITAQR